MLGRRLLAASNFVQKSIQNFKPTNVGLNVGFKVGLFVYTENALANDPTFVGSTFDSQQLLGKHFMENLDLLHECYSLETTEGLFSQFQLF